MYAILFKSIIIGFVITVPVGPIGLLCISRALSAGTAYGLVSWLGVATASALAGGMVALGLALVPGLPISLQPWLRLAAGAFLCYLGVRIFMARPARQPTTVTTSGLLRGFTSTFFLTATDPSTFPSLFAIYAGWGIKGLSGEYFSAGVLSSGIFFGAALWCLIVGTVLLFYRDRFSVSQLGWLQRMSGAVIAAFGLVVVSWR